MTSWQLQQQKKLRNERRKADLRTVKFDDKENKMAVVDRRNAVIWQKMIAVRSRRPGSITLIEWLFKGGTHFSGGGEWTPYFCMFLTFGRSNPCRYRVGFQGVSRAPQLNKGTLPNFWDSYIGSIRPYCLT